MKYEERIVRLAETFPTLEDAPLRPWDAERFEEWAMRQAGSGLLHSARFVLKVWAIDHPWKVGPFDVFHAVFSWDERHRNAFANWAKAPWIR